MPVIDTGAAPARRNLVLGMAWGLQVEDLELFAKSLRRVASTAEVVLFSKEVSPAVQKLAAEDRILLLPITNCYYGLCKSAAKRNPRESFKRVRNYFGIKLINGLMRAAYPIIRLGYTAGELGELRREVRKLIVHTYSSRFVQYLDFLRNQNARYDKVMLTDVRDVCFQADPFAQIPDNQLWMFAEEGFTIGASDYNRRWVRALYGRKVLEKIAAKPVICAGVTIGSFANVVGYLEAMESDLLGRSPIYIPDQGIHNALAHTGAFQHLNPIIVKNGDGPVLTAGSMKEEQFRWDDSGRLVNSRGMPYAVIHQFDRFPNVMARLQKLK